jgi:hypothetical protein
MKIDIATLANGALNEQVAWEFQKVLENISDPNTDPYKKRKIIICLNVEGDDNRDITDVTFQTKSILVPARSISTRIAFEKRGNTMIAEELKKSAMKGQLTIDERGLPVEPLISNTNTTERKAVNVEMVGKVLNMLGGQ